MPLPEPKWAWEREVGGPAYGTHQIAKTHPVALRNRELVDVLIRTIVP